VCLCVYKHTQTHSYRGKLEADVKLLNDIDFVCLERTVSAQKKNHTHIHIEATGGGSEAVA
jgi:hypothetical protein